MWRTLHQILLLFAVIVFSPAVECLAELCQSCRSELCSSLSWKKPEHSCWVIFHMTKVELVLVCCGVFLCGSCGQSQHHTWSHFSFLLAELSTPCWWPVLFAATCCKYKQCPAHSSCNHKFLFYSLRALRSFLNVSQRLGPGFWQLLEFWVPKTFSVLKKFSHWKCWFKRNLNSSSDTWLWAILAWTCCSSSPVPCLICSQV